MPSVQIGQVITGPKNDQYSITDFLGRGAFGEVYRAVAESSGTVIAVKLLPFAGISDPTSRIALLNEMKAALEISHPNVVRVLHVNEGTTELGPYSCLEYISGGTLASLLRTQRATKTKIPLSRALEMMIDVAQGLRAINQKLVHRDIKPDNILIEGNLLKISDFGISKFIAESTRSNTFKGGQHVAYMAPEAWANQKNTHKIDVYAAGIVFHEILTLEHPREKQVKDPSNFLDWQNAHLYAKVPGLRDFLPDVSIALVQLFSRMVAKRPQERPEWDETLRILSDPINEPRMAESPRISEAVKLAVESAVQKRQEQEKRALEDSRRAEEQRRVQNLYQSSCENLLDTLMPPIEQFNRSYQFGKIDIRRSEGQRMPPSAEFILPNGGLISVRLFYPSNRGVQLHRKELIGGGWIGIEKGRSANLLLMRTSSDDLYGEWSVCEVKIMALADPRKLIGRFGITQDTVEPFGFKNQNDFYEQIPYANGGLHVFTYSLGLNVVDRFSTLILDACS